jgi:hypothetical protein
MRSLDGDIIKQAQDFTARWGFLTRGLFFKFFCTKRRTQKFEYWNRLVETSLFVRSKSNSEILFLSRRGRKLLAREARPARFHIFIEHDSIVADVLLTLQQLDLIREYWLEDELMRDSVLAYEVLGADKVYRIPDLVFDLRTQSGGHVRAVLEVEKTLKTSARYEMMALSYRDYNHINLVLFGCDSAYTSGVIKRSFSAGLGDNQRIVPGIFLYENFLKSALSANVRFADKEFLFENMLRLVTQQSAQGLSSKPDVNRTAVRFRNSKMEAV